jgi:hypothetical protein
MQRMDLTDAQQQTVLLVVSAFPWGDSEGALRVIDEGLAIAMRAARNEFVFWQEHADGAGFPRRVLDRRRRGAPAGVTI